MQDVLWRGAGGERMKKCCEKTTQAIKEEIEKLGKCMTAVDYTYRQAYFQAIDDISYILKNIEETIKCKPKK